MSGTTLGDSPFGDTPQGTLAGETVSMLVFSQAMGAEAASEATAEEEEEEEEEEATARERTPGTATREAAPAAISAWPDMAQLESTSTGQTTKGIVGIKGTKTREIERTTNSTVGTALRANECHGAVAAQPERRPRTK